MIDAADQQKRKLREKFPMLVRHELAYHTPAYRLHFFLHSRSRLRGALAAMKRGCIEGPTGKVSLSHVSGMVMNRTIGTIRHKGICVKGAVRAWRNACSY